MTEIDSKLIFKILNDLKRTSKIAVDEYIKADNDFQVHVNFTKDLGLIIIEQGHLSITEKGKDFLLKMKNGAVDINSILTNADLVTVGFIEIETYKFKDQEYTFLGRYEPESDIYVIYIDEEYAEFVFYPDEVTSVNHIDRLKEYIEKHIKPDIHNNQI